LGAKEAEIKAKFTAAAKEMTSALTELKQAQLQVEAKLNVKRTALQKKGLSGNIAELKNYLSVTSVNPFRSTPANTHE